MTEIFAATATFGLLAAAFGWLLGWSSVRFRVEGDPVADRIDALLPQTQCGQCDYPGCRPYAEALAKGGAPINRCAPGGEATMLALADLLEVDPNPLDPERDKSQTIVAVIDEDLCIGCTQCIQACPVDAILGTSKRMHTVIASECTGCELCLPPCPVDCIDLTPLAPDLQTWQAPRPTRFITSESARAGVS